MIFLPTTLHRITPHTQKRNYLRTKNLPLDDEFVGTANPYIREIGIGMSYSLDGRWLIKLHGSIWEFKQ